MDDEEYEAEKNGSVSGTDGDKALIGPPGMPGVTGVPVGRLYEWTDMYQVTFGDPVDLNDPATYEKCRYRDWSCSQLRDEIYRLVGFATLYEKYFGTDMVCPEPQRRNWNGRKTGAMRGRQRRNRQSRPPRTYGAGGTIRRPGVRNSSRNTKRPGRRRGH